MKLLIMLFLVAFWGMTLALAPLFEKRPRA